MLYLGNDNAKRGSDIDLSILSWNIQHCNDKLFHFLHFIVKHPSIIILSCSFFFPFVSKLKN